MFATEQLLFLLEASEMSLLNKIMCFAEPLDGGSS
jgi:hypothetical protein